MDLLRFGGIHEYRLGEAPPQVTELTGDQQIILEVLGERYRQIYSLNQVRNVGSISYRLYYNKYLLARDYLLSSPLTITLCSRNPVTNLVMLFGWF